MFIRLAFSLCIASILANLPIPSEAQTTQTGIPDGFEIVEEAQIQVIRRPDGVVVRRQVPAVLRRIPAEPGIVETPPQPNSPPDGWHAAPTVFSTAGLGAVWSDPVIPVCWENADPAFAQGRQWTQEAVEASWEEVSNVDFIGWRSCRDEDRGIRIAVDSVGPHVIALGRKIDGTPNGMVLNFTFENWGTGCADHLEYCIKALAVHEFGHALGLAHEHNREDRNLCETEPQGPLPAFLMTTYDPSSVMNYCAADWNNNGRLSPLDVAGIRLLYGPYTDETPAQVGLAGGIALRNADFEIVGELPIDASFALTDLDTRQSQSVSGCLDDNLWIEATITANIRPGESKVSVNSQQNIYGTSNCEPSDTLLMSDEDTYSLVEPGNRALAGGSGFVEYRDGAPHRQARFNFTLKRTVGQTTETATCTTCAAAAAEANFVVGPAPLALSGTALHGTNEIASPWPDDFNVDFEACATKAQASTRFGSEPWTEEQLDTLCEAAPSSEQPALCFAETMGGTVEWGAGTQWVPENALSLCAGSTNMSETLRCFSDQISSGTQWPIAIKACNAN